MQTTSLDTMTAASTSISALSAIQMDRSRPLREQVYGLVRQLVLSGKLPAGSTVDEKKIAARLGISRTPVREAVKRLSDQSLVVVKPQSGTTVSPIRRRDVEEAIVVRRALEMESVAAAAKVFTPRNRDQLNEIILRHRHALETRQYADAIGLDDDFHCAIAEIADLPKLWQAVHEYKAPLDRCRHLTLPKWGSGETTLDQHTAIADALSARDSDLAVSRMHEHLKSTAGWLRRYLDEVGAT